MKTLRVLPVMMAGAGLLFVLKVIGLATSGGFVMAQPAAPAPPRVDYARVDPAYRPVITAARGNGDDIITGAVGAAQAQEKAPEGQATPEAAEGEKPAEGTAPVTPDTPVGASTPFTVPDNPVSPAERQLLERLQERRQEIEARGRELEVREELLKAMEIKLEERVAELKDLEVRLQAAAPAAEAEKAQAEATKKQMKDLVVMYENMKPKEAARIFDQLDMKVLVSVVLEMNPRKTSEIIAKMTPASAQKLTVALAAQPNRNAGVSPDSLPKIPGQR
jgi:flagellar motility protein MotE (MotC chaperone)